MSGLIGWDMGTALSLAEALGVSTWLAAEMLPEIEAEVVAALTETKEEGDGRG